MARELLPGQLRINDLIFDIPPQDIQVIKRENNLSVPTLRSTSSTKIKTGTKDVIFIISLTFATGYNHNTHTQQSAIDHINRQLVPLIIQARKCPFWSIESEKIRKDMAGEMSEGPVSFSKNMAVYLDSMRINTDINSPEKLTVQLVLKWFNYSPYSVDFKYLADSELAGSQEGDKFSNLVKILGDREDKIRTVDSPEDSHYYKLFYKNGTTIDDGNSFINQVQSSDFTSDFDIVYKEYTDYPNETRFGEWQQLSTLLTAGKNLYYRYRNFKISTSFPGNKSGALIPINLEITIAPKIPSLPLLSQMMPTAQFLGATDVVVNLSLFANAELNGETPISSSEKLAELSNVLASVQRNALQYRLQSRRDPIFIRHPLLKLVNYDIFSNETITYKDDGDIRTLNPRLDPVFSCIPNSFDSKTDPKSPFANVVDISFIESLKNTSENTRLQNQGLGRNIYETLARGLQQFISDSKFIVDEKNLALLENQPNPTAQAFAAAAFGSLGKLIFSADFRVDPNLNIQPIYQNPFGSDTPIDLLKTRVGSINVKERELGIKVKRRLEKLLTLKVSKDILAGIILESRGNEAALEVFSRAIEDEGMAEELRLLTNDFIEFLLRAKPAGYQAILDELNTANTVSADSAYPDMKLPANLSSISRSEAGLDPDFYWSNISDTTFRATQIAGERVARDEFIKQYKEDISTLTNQELVEKNVSTKVKASRPPPPLVSNISRDDKENNITRSQIAVHDFSVDSQALVLSASIKGLKDETYIMRRAMPTFKLYFLNDKTPVRGSETKNVWSNFDDFYNVNSIKEIRLIRSREIASDTLILHLTNLENDIVNADFPQVKTGEIDVPFLGKFDKYEPSYGLIDGKFITKSSDFPRRFEKFDKLMLSEGTKIQLRLGYSSDPEDLSIEFNGRVSQISGSEILEIVCQSHAVELEAEEKGVEEQGDKFSFNSETNDLLAKLIFTSPEVVSFGDRGDNKFLPWNEFISRYLGGNFIGGSSLADNLFAPPLGYGLLNFSEQLFGYIVFGAGLGLTAGSILGIGAVPVAGIGAVIGTVWGLFEGILNKVLKIPFTVYSQTVWDVMKELELRHPDCICSVVPYDTRMTIFFGYPEQLYFYRDFKFLDAAQRESSILGQKITQRGLDDRDFTETINRLNRAKADLANQEKIETASSPFDLSEIIERGPPTPSSREISQEIGKFESELELLLSFKKPFRNYHFITSEHHIISNNIRADYEGTYNAIKIYHPKDGANGNFDGTVGFENYEATPTVAADDDIHPNFIRTGTFVFHNARKEGGIDLSKEYALSTLKKSLEQLYKGEITILGRPEIKPYDVIFIFDTYNSIFGAIQVRQVIQSISYEVGWTTEIVPDMLIYTNNHAGRAILEGIAKVYGAQCYKNLSLFYAANYDFRSIPDESLDVGPNIDRYTDTASIVAIGAIGKSAYGVLKGQITDLGTKELNYSVPRIALASETNKITAGLIKKSIKVPRFAALGVSGLFKLGRNLGGAATFVLGTLFLDSAINKVFSWAENREPLIFVPLKRNGLPWILGLYGMRPDSTIDSFIEDADEWLSDTKTAFGRAISKIVGDDFSI